MATASDGHDDDFDGEARPRRGQKSGSTALIAMICLGLLLVGGMIFALVYFLGGSSNNLDAEMLAYLPAETNAMAGIDVEDLLKNDKMKGLVGKFLQSPPGQEVGDMLKAAEVSEGNISRVLIGGKSSAPWNRSNADKTLEEKNEEPRIFVIRFKNAVDKAKIAQAMKLSEQNKNGKTYYKSETQKELLLYFPSDVVMVVASSERQIDRLTTKDPAKIVITEELHDLAKKTSKGQIWAVVSRSWFGEELKKVDELKKSPVPGDLVGAVSGMRGAGFYLKVEGDKTSFGVALLCSEAKAASKAAEALEKEVDKIRKEDLEKNALVGAKIAELPPEAKKLATEIQKSLTVGSSGAMLEISASFTGVDKLIDNLLEKGPVDVQGTESVESDKPDQGLTNPIEKVKPLEKPQTTRPEQVDPELKKPLTFPKRSEFKLPDAKDNKKPDKP